MWSKLPESHWKEYYAGHCLPSWSGLRQAVLMLPERCALVYSWVSACKRCIHASSEALQKSRRSAPFRVSSSPKAKSSTRVYAGKPPTFRQASARSRKLVPVQEMSPIIWE